ncbi:MAG: tetratricopeptide repeat protein [Bacteroidia bacterium]
MKQLARKIEASLESMDSVFIDLLDAESLFHYYLFEGKLKQADNLLQLTRDLYPGSGLVSHWSALLALENGHNEAALDFAREAIANAPGEMAHQLVHAEALTRNGFFDEASAELEELRGAAEFPEEVLVQMGDISQIQGNLPKSIKYYKEALTLNPDYSPAILELAALLESQGEVEESIALFTQHLEKHPFSAAIWYELGGLHARQEQYDEALEAFEYALVIDDDFAEAYYRKALCLMALHQYKEALPVLLEVLNKKHVEPHVHFHTAVSYEQMEMYADAARHFHFAASADPHHAEAWLGLGRCFAQREQYVEAIHAYEKAVKLEEEHAETYLDIAICEYKLGNSHAAGSHMQNALRVDDKNPDIWLGWASLLVSDDRLDSAIEFLEAGMSIQPRIPSLYYRCSAYLYAAGRDEACFYMLEQALVQDDGDKLELCEIVPDLLEDPAYKRLVKRYVE